MISNDILDGNYMEKDDLEMQKRIDASLHWYEQLNSKIMKVPLTQPIFVKLISRNFLLSFMNSKLRT